MTRHDESGADRVPLEDALRALRRPEDPPGEVEEHVLDRLVSSGAVARIEGSDRTAATMERADTHHSAYHRWTRYPWLRAVAAALAGVAIFAAGVVAGAQRDAVIADGPRYALLLLPGPELLPASGAEEEARVREYGAWAGRLAANDRLVLAEKLGATVATIDANGPTASPVLIDDVLGMFVIVADTDAQALAAARESPHTAAGGRIAIIRIDPT